MLRIKKPNTSTTTQSYSHTIIPILWVLTFFFLIRLIGITNPPLEIGHNWRQALTNMVARNFLEVDANIFFPRIDIAGEKTGIMGAEFPIFNYLIYLTSAIFGYQHWYGRLINLIVSSVGVYYFFLLIKELFDKKTASYAAIILTVSVWFDFSRKSMPDTFSIALVLIGFYYGYRYLKNGFTWRLALFFILITLGVLSKLSALSLWSLLLVPLLIRQIPTNRKIAMTAAASLGFLIVCVWYFYWVPYLVETYGYMLYFPRSLSQGMAEVATLWRETLEKFYFSAFHSYVAFACFLAGIFFLIKGKNNYLKIGVVAFLFIFFLFILKTGEVFPLHNYYIIPFVPLMALIAALALVRMKPLYAGILLFAIAIEGIANQQHEFFIKDNERYKITLESIADRVTQPSNLIIINDGERDPQQMYFAHRRGWTIENKHIADTSYINGLKKLGATHLFIDKHSFDRPLNYKVEYEDTHYRIYRLE